MVSLDFIAHCAPSVAPETIQQIIQVESGGNPLAIHANGNITMKKAHSATEAMQFAQTVIAKGHSIDIGLMQVNSQHLKNKDYALQDLLDPCTNIKAGAAILLDNYSHAIKQYGEGQEALRAALSAYNTGNFQRGFTNGYVEKYYPTPPKETVSSLIPTQHFVINATTSNPYSADTTVFIRGA